MLVHRGTFGGDDGFSRTTVSPVFAPGHQPHGRELPDLTTDGAVVAPDATGEVDDADRTEAANQNDEWEKRPLQSNVRFLQQYVVKLRSIDDGDNIQHRIMDSTQALGKMCITHEH